MQNPVVSREDWLKARLDLLDAEKEFTRQRDALTRRHMAMPWVRVEKDYRFEGPNGCDEDGLDFSMAWLRRHDSY